MRGHCVATRASLKRLAKAGHAEPLRGYASGDNTHTGKWLHMLMLEQKVARWKAVSDAAHQEEPHTNGEVSGEPAQWELCKQEN